jgi:tRNA G18 (ribose-2'-O)-methylase SpoU
VKSDRELTYGLRAGLALLARRAQDVTRVLFAKTAARAIEPQLKLLRARGVPCEFADDRDLERLARTVQHEGLCVEALARTWLTPQELAARLAHVRGAAIALDRVRNSYNVGAILRTAAFFGLDGVVIGAPAPHPGLDPNAARVAEGGAEELALARTTDLADTLAQMRKAGVRVIGADQNATVDARDYAFPRPALVVMGNEREGLGERARAACDATVGIRGAGAVESLNVGVAAGILLARLARSSAQ